MRKDILNSIIQMKEVKDLINKSEIARRFNCSINTVNKYLNIQENNKSTRKYSSKLDDFKGIIIEKTDDFSANGRAIFNFIKDKGFTGSYGTVSKFIKEHKQEEQNKATMRFETTPGFQAQVDWKENFKIINKDGKEFEINIFLMILGYSRYKYIELTLDKSQDTLFECIMHACNSFGGVPHEILFDNMATVVDRLSSTYRAVVINKKFAQFAKDVGFVVNTCRPYRPQTKGKIECVAKLMDRLKVYNKEFATIEELDDIVNKLMTDINNEDINFVEKPTHRLKEEQKYLSSLPSIDCVSQYFRQNKGYKVSKESMITYKKHKYSVPIRYIGEYLTVSENEDTLNIYYTTDLIASHKISDKFLNYKKEHVHEILKSDALKTKSDDKIDEFIEENLTKMDIFLS